MKHSEKVCPHKILNDIAEGIDCRETRAQLREALVTLSSQLEKKQNELNVVKDRQLRDVMDHLLSVKQSSIVE